MARVSTVWGVVVLVVVVVEVCVATHPALNRWRRQAVHCQAGDAACQACSASCPTVEESRLPECCEAYNACCDQYFQACKKCSVVAAKDQYFPEYCCASFTDCCDLVTTFNTAVKPPEVVRKEPKTALKIPTVAAPKPTTFPGLPSPDSFAPVASPFPSHTQPAPHSPLTPQHTPFTSQNPQSASPGQTNPRVVGGQRGKTGPRTQHRSQSAAQSHRPKHYGYAAPSPADVPGHTTQGRGVQAGLWPPDCRIFLPLLSGGRHLLLRGEM
ncbi:hypothetical protein GWK47_016794 [Chionoecetes opilio]|uniref:Uncharacterized protein n=1 Tax=Chionoecetes opilio TaxID=41210 RepID=A0A8J5CK34_CHIOP|nr:hypothetical protein GWK47_016794 [Chionoecetes opilio]